MVDNNSYLVYDNRKQLELELLQNNYEILYVGLDGFMYVFFLQIISIFAKYQNSDNILLIIFFPQKY